MELFLNILFLVIGLVLLIKGADFFVSGASSLATKLKVPALFIGLTVVALGTSLPELSVSVISAIQHSTDLSVSNIIGSNMFNMLIALGVVAIISPLAMQKTSKKIDFPFLIIITGCLLLFSCDIFLDGAEINKVSRIESILFLCLLVAFLFFQIKNAKEERANVINNELNAENKPEEIKEFKMWKTILYLVMGLGFVVFGGECVSSTAKYLALQMGMSEALVGLTIVALGTSLPEFVTSVIASLKGEMGLALGNIIGSNILNISLVIGLVGTINPFIISTAILTDMIILFCSTLIFTCLCFKNNKLTRIDGIILVAIYVAYLTFAIIRNYM